MKKKIDKAWLDAYVKFSVEITAEGFDIDNDDFRIDFYGETGKHAAVEKDDFIGEGDHVVVLDTSLVGAGLVQAVTTAYIPDDSCPDGQRKEIDSQCILQVLPVKEPMFDGKCKCNAKQQNVFVNDYSDEISPCMTVTFSRICSIGEAAYGFTYTFPIVFGR